MKFPYSLVYSVRPNDSVCWLQHTRKEGHFIGVTEDSKELGSTKPSILCKVATITVFAVPFSSFSAFVTYAALGSISIKILPSPRAYCSLRITA
jgi:hypothetical protein